MKKNLYILLLSTVILSQEALSMQVEDAANASISRRAQAPNAQATPVTWDLPQSIWLEVFKHLPQSTVRFIPSVCQLWKKLSDQIPFWKKIRQTSLKFPDAIPGAISNALKNSFKYTTSFNSSSLYDKGKSRSLKVHFQLTPLQKKYFEVLLTRYAAKDKTILQRLPSVINEIAARAAARDMYCSRPDKNGTPLLKNKVSWREKFLKTDEIELPLVIIQSSESFNFEMECLTADTPEGQSSEEEY